MNSREIKLKSLKVRFFECVSFPKSVDSCWEWVGNIAGGGYGLLSFKNVAKGAHRVSWEIFNGEIPEGMSVLHHCDNRKCVNPNHLFLGTYSDNMYDMWKKKRHPTENMGRTFETMEGELNPKAKLTKEDVLEMRRLWKTGQYKQQELADMFGIKLLAAWRAINGWSWSHI